MTLYALAIRRPVLAWVMSMTIVLFGTLGFTRLGVREFPSLDPPMITVSTDYVGANADVIQAQVTEPLEEAINSVDGIRTLISVSRAGRSTVEVEFDLDADLERAANDVRSHVSRALERLPPDVDPPQVSKADADAPAIVMLWVRGDGWSLTDLSRLARNVLVERLQTIEGVSRIDVWGEREPAMRIWPDPQRLAAHRLSLLDVRDAVERENVELPSGQIEGDAVELAVRTLSRLNAPEQYADLILKQEDGRVVRLADVGHAELGARNPRTVLKTEGVPMVAVAARPQPGANYVDIANQLYKRVEQIRRDLPRNVEIGYGWDTTRFIRHSIAEVVQTVFVALLLVIGVIFAFLRDFRTTVIPVLVIPVSLIGAFVVMWGAGFSINVLTLLALVLAIGLVVDDAIIVLENVYSKIESGLPPTGAGISGTREVFFAVIATTLALISVLLPLFFLGGFTGRLFREFGGTLIAAVAISAFVALTLTSMLSSRVLKRRQVEPWLYRKTEPFFRAMIGGYARVLTRFLARRWLVLPIFAVCVALIGLFMTLLPSELAPIEDRSQIRLQVTGPEGATFAYMDAYMDDVIRTVRDEVPQHQAIITVTSPGFSATSATNSGVMHLILSEPSERERSQQEIAEALEARVAGLTRAQTTVTQDPTISVGGSRGRSVQFVLQAPNLAALEGALPRFLKEADRHPAFSIVEEDLKFTNPELQVSIDRARARDLGVSARDVGETLQLALSERRIGFFLLDGKQYEVISQVTRENRLEPTDLRNLYVPAASGEPVLLDRLVTVTEESRPPQLYRFDRFASATVSARLAPAYTLSDGIAAMEEIADRVLDDSFSTALAGESRDFVESSRALLFIFLLALALVYLLLAAQFESFRDPLTIMLTVPLALAGALGFLWYFGQTLNLFSQIGIIMLIGLITKNGILIVEFANQRRAVGRSIYDAVIEAATARFRPVLMTTLSTVLGILPIALALGAGAESRVPLGISVLGGLLLGSALTLFVVPALYTYLTRKTLVGKEVEAGEAGDSRGAPGGPRAALPAAVPQAAPPRWPGSLPEGPTS